MKEFLGSAYGGIAILVFIYNFIFVSYGTSWYEIGHDLGAALLWPIRFIKLFF